MSIIDRRMFLTHGAMAGIAATTLPHVLTRQLHAAAGNSKTRDQFCVFTESFQSWPIPKVCEKFASIGLDGLDLTVRHGGHIQPEDAVTKLPAAAKAAKLHGVQILMLTTSINDDDDTAEQILGTCGELGISRVKLGYFPYKEFGSLLATIDETRSRIERVATLAQKYNVLPCVHIHSGDTIPASGPTAHLLLKDFKPAEVGAYVDPMHMTIEGALDGWRQGLDLLSPWITISSMKNYFWIKVGRDKHGQERWAVRKCPLADGMAPIPDFISTLQDAGYHGLYSLHSEYQGGGSWKGLNADEAFEQTKLDFEYVKKLVNS